MSDYPRWFNAVCAETGHKLQFQIAHVAVVRDKGGNTLGLVMSDGGEWTVEKDGMTQCEEHHSTPSPEAASRDEHE